MILTEESRIFPLKQPGFGGGSEMLAPYSCQRQDGEIGPDMSSRHVAESKQEKRYH